MGKESGSKVLPFSVEGNEGRDGLWRALCRLSGIAEPAAPVASSPTRTK
jgi:hypothetical protein